MLHDAEVVICIIDDPYHNLNVRWYTRPSQR